MCAYPGRPIDELPDLGRKLGPFVWLLYQLELRLLEPIGNIPPVEAEQRYYAMLDDVPLAA